MEVRSNLAGLRFERVSEIRLFSPDFIDKFSSGDPVYLGTNLKGL